MKQRGVVAFVAFLLAAGATVGVFLYVRGVKHNNAAAAANMVQVIVSKQDIPAGTRLDGLIAKGDAFTTLQVPSAAVVPGAVTHLAELQSQTTSTFILRDEQITTARLQGSTEVTGGVLGIPNGYQAVTIQLEAQRVVNQAIQTGDHVVVYATTTQLTGNLATVNGHGAFFPGATLTLVPDVQVLRIQNPTSSSGSNANSLVTLALKPHDAAAVIAAQAQGDTWLAALPPNQHGVSQRPVYIGG